MTRTIAILVASAALAAPVYAMTDAGEVNERDKALGAEPRITTGERIEVPADRALTSREQQLRDVETVERTRFETEAEAPIEPSRIR
jgi:hypothetical protein